VRAVRLFPSNTVAGFAPGSVVVTLSGGGSAATLVAVRFHPASQITLSMACGIASDIADGTPASYRLAGASGRIVSTSAQCRGLPSAVPDRPTTAASQAEHNTSASSADDDGSWWVPILIVVLFVVLLLGVLMMWRKREQANADVLAGLRTARQSSNPAFGASTDAPVAFDNPTYGVGTPQGLGYLQVEGETRTYDHFVNLDTSSGMASQYGGDTYTYTDGDDLTYTDGDAATYAVALEPNALATRPYDTCDTSFVSVPSVGEAHYAIPMEGGAGVALGNSLTGYAAIEGLGLYDSPSDQYQTAVELGDVQNSSA